MYKSIGCLISSGIFFIFLFVFPFTPVAQEEVTPEGVPAKLAAEYIHSIIQASRGFYSKEIVGRLDKTLSLKATEDWELKKTLPLPAQFLKLSANNLNELGIGLKIRLLSLNPINKENLPKTDQEELGLRDLSLNPEKPFTWIAQRGRTWNFRTIYPDIASSESCVSCHNSHPKSSIADFKLGDVMGGILIDFPLSNTPLDERGLSVDREDFLVSPQIVSDYIHAILESDRFVYTKIIVNRMKVFNLVEASESWQDNNGLPLPAQFLINTGHWAKNSKLKLNFRLISLWPINFTNSAANEFERNGLISVSQDPLRPYIGKFKRGRSKYFQAIYPDIAISQSCVDCHNAHPKSPKKDFELDDIMGGMVVNFPIIQSSEKNTVASIPTLPVTEEPVPSDTDTSASISPLPVTEEPLPSNKDTVASISPLPKTEKPEGIKVARLEPGMAEETPEPLTVHEEMVLIASGKYVWGDSAPPETKHLPSFYMDAQEVIQKDYERVTGTNPSRFKGENLPVEKVTWGEAREYCQRIGKRLPTSEEWEKAARAGTSSTFYWGNALGQNKANCNDCGSKWDGLKTAPVRSFKPNNWGLYDMAGNVWEWVDTSYNEQFKVLRGGSWVDEPIFLHPAEFYFVAPENRSGDIGFRCARNEGRDLMSGDNRIASDEDTSASISSLPKTEEPLQSENSAYKDWSIGGDL